MTLRSRGTAKRLSHLRRDSGDEQGIERLVQRAQQGDERAFTDLYMRHVDRVYGYMRVALDDSVEAEDASRQVFLKVVGLISGYEQGEQTFTRWLFKVARNEALDRLRERDALSVEDPADVRRWTESVRTDGLRASLWKSDSDLMRVIEELPEAQRRAILLRYVLDFEDADIADVLGLAPREVRRLQGNALSRLDRRIAELGSDPGARHAARTSSHASAAAV